MVRLVLILILAGTLALSQASIDYDRAGRLRQVFSRGHHPSTRLFDPNLTPRCYSTCMPPHTSWTTPLQQRDEAPRSSVSGNTATPFWYLCRSARRPMNKSPQPFCSWVVELVCGTTPDSASLGAPADRGSILGSGRDDSTQSTAVAAMGTDSMILCCATYRSLLPLAWSVMCRFLCAGRGSCSSSTGQFMVLNPSIRFCTGVQELKLAPARSGMLCRETDDHPEICAGHGRSNAWWVVCSSQ